MAGPVALAILPGVVSSAYMRKAGIGFDVSAVGMEYLVVEVTTGSEMAARALVPNCHGAAREDWHS